MKVLPFVYALLSICLSSCYYNSRLVYLQDKNFSEVNPILIQNIKSVYRLQPSDILSVKVKSATETGSNAIFNVSSNTDRVYATPGSLFLDGYNIDSNGKINLPVIGEIRLSDLTLEEAQQHVQIEVNKYLIDATVIVKLTSFKVTVLGEVKNPGYVYVFNNRVTILEVVGLAGDLTPFANRKNVKLIRQIPGGSDVILLDLTDPKLLASAFYDLLPNDVVYVEPLRARAKRANLEIVGVIFAGLTAGVLILSYVQQH